MFSSFVGTKLAFNENLHIYSLILWRMFKETPEWKWRWHNPQRERFSNLDDGNLIGLHSHLMGIRNFPDFKPFIWGTTQNIKAPRFQRNFCSNYLLESKYLSHIWSVNLFWRNVGSIWCSKMNHPKRVWKTNCIHLHMRFMRKKWTENIQFPSRPETGEILFRPSWDLSRFVEEFYVKSSMRGEMLKDAVLWAKEQQSFSKFQIGFVWLKPLGMAEPILSLWFFLVLLLCVHVRSLCL